MQERASRIYLVTGLALVVVGQVVLLLLWRDYRISVTFLFDLALISGVLAFFQDEISVPSKWKVIGAWSYTFGVILVISSSTWLNSIFWARLESLPNDMLYSDLVLELFKVDIAFPGLMFFPAAMTLAGISTSRRRELPGRIYVVGGLTLIVLVLARVWYGAFQKWFQSESDGIRALTAGVLSYPTFLALAALAILLGCLPDRVHPGRRLGSALAISYLMGTVLFSVGLHTAVWPPWPHSVPLLLTPGFLLTAPVLLVTLYRFFTLSQREETI